MAETKTYHIKDGYYSWDQVFNTVLSCNVYDEIIVSHWMVPSIPENAKARLAYPKGQIADYGIGLPDKRGIHIKVHEDHYKIHWDNRDPNTDPLGHLAYDCPELLLAIIGGVGAGIGAYAYHKYKKSQN